MQLPPKPTPEEIATYFAEREAAGILGDIPTQPCRLELSWFTRCSDAMCAAMAGMTTADARKILQRVLDRVDRRAREAGDATKVGESD